MQVHKHHPVAQAHPEREWAPSREKSWALPYSMQDLRKKQMEDPDMSPVLKWLGKRGKASWTRSCSLKSCNLALLVVLGIPED